MIWQRSIPVQVKSLTWQQLWRRYHVQIGALLGAALILVFHGFALQLPFFFDDLPIMTWLRRHGWSDIWLRSTENAYYRPLTFTVYKLGLLLPMGARQMALHGVSLFVYWLSGLLVFKMAKLCGHGAGRALLAAVLFVVFPFNFLAVPWVTAMPHHLVTVLALIAAYSALRAERERALRWWGASLTATLLAPLAHESGAVCGLIVAGVVMFQHPFKPSFSAVRANRRRILILGLGVLLNLGAVWLRPHVPGVGKTGLAGLDSWFANGMFFLHGLLYPIAPVIGWLVHHRGWHDFTLIQMGTALLALVVIGVLHRTRDWRWAAASLWWWACGSLPAAMSLKYGYLYTSPRLYALASVGIVMLWAGLVVELGKTLRHTAGRRLAWGILAGAVIVQNGAFLAQRHPLFSTLDQVYQQVLQAAKNRENAPLGFVNLPAWLAYPHKTYAMVTEGVEFLPPYSNVGEFIEVNQAWAASDGVMFTPVLKGTTQTFGFRGKGLDWEAMRQFALDHRTVWLTVYQDDRFVLKHVGSIVKDATPLPEPLVRFEGGPVIETASVSKTAGDEWAVALTWFASGPVDGEVFVHVRDASGNVVAQADGPALGGMVPVWLWKPGDRLYDVRHLILPRHGAPYTVQVGVYTAQGRVPAWVYGVRAPDDAPTVATISLDAGQ